MVYVGITCHKVGIAFIFIITSTLISKKEKKMFVQLLSRWGSPPIQARTYIKLTTRGQLSGLDCISVYILITLITFMRLSKTHSSSKCILTRLAGFWGSPVIAVHYLNSTNEDQTHQVTFNKYH